MQKFELFEAKQKLSELVERASNGEQTAIMKHGRVVALIVPATSRRTLKAIFNDLEKIRRRARLPKGMTVKRLISDGRM